MKRHATLLACLLPLLTIPTPAQDSVPDTRPVTSFKVPAGEMSLTDLIDRSAALLDCNILYAPAEVAGSAPVRLQKAIDTDRDGYLDLLTNLLYRQGLVLTVFDERQNIYEVILTTGHRGREVTMRAQSRSPEEVLAAPQRAVPVTVAVPLQHINATIATNALRPFFASTGGGGGGMTLGNVGNNTNMLLSGMQNQVAQAILLLRTCDVPHDEIPEHDPMLLRIQTLEARIAELEKRLAAAGGKER